MLYDFKKVYEKGWCVINADLKTDDDLLTLANSVGVVCKNSKNVLIEELKVKTRTTSTHNTFSFNYEFNSFPLHTDTAFWPTPARFVLLNSKAKSSAATTIVNIKDLFRSLNKREKDLVKDSIFLLSTPKDKFYTRLINRYHSDYFFRYDPNCMKAVNESAFLASKILREKLADIAMERVVWDGPKALLLDNWKMLHGRDSVDANDRDRILKRIYINQT